MESVAEDLVTLATIVGAVIIILSPIWAASFWIYKKVLSPVHKLIQKELAPNEGQSMKDIVSSMAVSQTRLETKLNNHLRWSRRFTRKIINKTPITVDDLEDDIPGS